MGFITFFLLKKLLNKGNAFIWNSKEKNIKAIKKINTIDLKLIVGVEKQKQAHQLQNQKTKAVFFQEFLAIKNNIHEKLSFVESHVGHSSYFFGNNFYITNITL